MEEHVRYEFELGRDAYIEIGDRDICVSIIHVSKEVVERAQSVAQMGDDITVTTLVERTVPCVRVGVEAPQDVPVHRSEVYEAIIRWDAEQLFLLFEKHGATKGDCMAAVQRANRNLAVAKALLAERFPQHTPQSGEPTL